MSDRLSEAEKERVRYHLGYMNVAAAASIQLGIPRPVETLFLVESALNLLIPESVPRVRSILCTLDGIELKLVEAQDRLAAEALGSLKLRSIRVDEGETDALEREYTRWANRLANVLGAPLYAGAMRFRSGRQTVGNVSVR